MNRYEPEPTVILSCNKERIYVDDVVFLDVYSDISERDILVYKCPNCGETHKSLIFL